MTQTLTVDADGEEITDDDITGLTALLTRLHEAESLEGLRVEIDANAGVMAGFAGGDVSIESAGEPVESTETTDEQPTEQVSTEEDESEGESASEAEGEDDEEESPTKPVLSSFDDPETAGEAWREYHEKTGEVPSLNPDAKYFAPLRVISEADDELTTGDIVEATEGTDDEMTTSQASSHLYTLLQKGVVERDGSNGPYEYSVSDLGEEALAENE